jgi:hypothetical protein
MTAGVVCAALILVLAAAQNPASAGSRLQYFEGQAVGNDKNSHFQFDAVNGKTRYVRVTRFVYQRVDVDCKYGEDTTASFAFSRSFRVGPDQKFRGTERARYGKLVVTAQIRAHFTPTGAAVGKLKVKSAGDRCTARWRAEPKIVG